MFPVPNVVLVVGDDWNRCCAEGGGYYGVSARDRAIMKDGDVKYACENLAYVLHRLSESKEVGHASFHISLYISSYTPFHTLSYSSFQ